MPVSISDGSSTVQIGHEFADFVNKIFGDFVLVIGQLSSLMLNGFSFFRCLSAATAYAPQLHTHASNPHSTTPITSGMMVATTVHFTLWVSL